MLNFGGVTSNYLNLQLLWALVIKYRNFSEESILPYVALDNSPTVTIKI